MVLVAGLAAFRARAAAEGVHSLSAFQTHFRSIIHGMSPYPHGANTIALTLKLMRVCAHQFVAVEGFVRNF